MNAKKSLILSMAGMGTISAVSIPLIISEITTHENKVISINEKSTQLNNDLYANSLSYNDLRTPFDKSLNNGFLKIFETIMKIDQNVVVNISGLVHFYQLEKDKVINLIDSVNHELLNRSFWGDLWSGIIHMVTAAFNTIAGAAATIVLGIADALTFGQIQALNNFVSDTASWTWSNKENFIKDFIGIDLKDFSHSNWIQFAATFLSFGIGQVLSPVIKTAAAALIGTTTSKIVSVAATIVIRRVVVMPIKSFIEFTGKKFEQTFDISNAELIKTLASFGSNIVSTITPGEYYFTYGDNAYHFTITDNLKLPDSNWHNVANFESIHFGNDVINKNFRVSEDGIHWVGEWEKLTTAR